MHSKMMTALIAVMVIFAFTAIASATPGDSPADPVDILYVYSSWGGTPFMAYPDLASAGTGSVTINGTTLYYRVTPVDGYSDDTWSYPSTDLLKYVNTPTSNYTNGDNGIRAEIVFFDMVNLYQDKPNQNAYFASSALNAAKNGTRLVSVRTGPTDTICYMPKGFAIRDTANMTPYLPYANGTANLNASNPYDCATFTTSFFANYDAFGPLGTASPTQSDQMKTLLINYYRNGSPDVDSTPMLPPMH